MERTDRALLRIGVERGYLDPQVAAAVLRQAKRTGAPVEELLLRGEVISRRRLARLRCHVRYRATREVDKLYAALAVRQGLLTRGQVKVSLEHQRTLFTSRRKCVRLGVHLIERELISVEQDRRLLAQATGAKIPSEVVRSAEAPSSAATLALHEGSVGPQVTPSSYQAIEAAVRRVDELRAMQKDLSTSDNVAGGDSANEIESALTCLARRRPPPEGRRRPARSSSRGRAPRRRSSRGKKTPTGLMKIFRLGAA